MINNVCKCNNKRYINIIYINITKICLLQDKYLYNLINSFSYICTSTNTVFIY